MKTILRKLARLFRRARTIEVDTIETEWYIKLEEKGIDIVELGELVHTVIETVE